MGRGGAAAARSHGVGGRVTGSDLVLSTNPGVQGRAG